MGSFTMPYMIPLFLGMTFDAQYSQPGVDIFDSQYVDHPLVVEHRKSESNYKVVTEVSDLLKTLDLSGDISLKIKSGLTDIEGVSSYLKNERNFQNSIVILTTFEYIAVVKTLSSNAKPRDGWAKQFSPDVLGNHYVSAITYGAKMIASAKVVVHDSTNVEEIKGDIQAALGSGGSGSSLVAEGKLNNLEKKLKGKANLEISFYGTVPLKSIPNTVDGLKELIGSFEDQIKEAGLEDGIPVSVMLTPLVDIADPEDKEKLRFVKNEALMTELDEFEENLDEMREARNRLATWAKTLPYDIKDEYRQEIGRLLRNLTNDLAVYYNTLWKMDLTKGPNQLNEAFNAYGNAGEYRKYDRLVNRLIKKIDKEVDKDANVASNTYIHWGSNNCTGQKTKLLHEGLTFSSAEYGIGGVAQYDCSPPNMEQKYRLESSKFVVSSVLAGIRYTKLAKDSNPFRGPNAKEISGKGVPCARCYSPDAAIISTFPATETCPMNSELKYKGYLMSARKDNGLTTEYICVDETPSEPYPMEELENLRNTLALTTVKSQGSLPEHIYPDDTLIKCVVCALKSKNTV